MELDRKKIYDNYLYGFPLFNLHKGSPFPMSINLNIFLFREDGVIVFAQTHNNQAKKYRIGKIKL
jgi:hypothetical protein